MISVFVDNDKVGVLGMKNRTKNNKFNSGVFYIIPALLVVASVMLFPIGYNVSQSFFENTLFNNGWEFVGLQQYKDILVDPNFRNALLNTIKWTAFSVACQFLLGSICAMVLSSDVLKRRGILRALIMLSWVLPSVIGSMMWKWMYHSDFGILNAALVRIGIISEPLAWTGSSSLALASAIIVNVWKMFPLVLLYIEASLQSVPVELYQAAAVDGANSWERFKAVTLPHVAGTCKTVILLLTIWTLNSFTFIYVLTGGGPGTSSQVLSLLIHQEAFVKFNFGRAATASTILFVIVAIFSSFYIRSTMKGDEQ